MPTPSKNAENPFDQVKIKFDGEEIDLLTALEGKNLAIKDAFLMVLKERFIDENWDFLKDMHDLYTTQRTPDAFKERLKTLSDLYFIPGDIEVIQTKI